MLRPLLLGALLLSGSPSRAAECVYATAAVGEDGPGEVAPRGDCGERVGDRLVLKRDHLARLSFAEGGLAVVLVLGRSGPAAFYIARSGRSRRALFVDNGADPFQEGLARVVSRGRIGFMNVALETVIPPRYDHADPFRDGAAVVCVGCTTRSVGEHREVVGGRWGVIDARGREIVPIRFTREELPEPGPRVPEEAPRAAP